MPIWCVDTSSLIAIRTLRSQCTREQFIVSLAGLDTLVREGRLRFPREVVLELERYEGRENLALEWTVRQGSGPVAECSLDDVALVLASVPEVVDADKEGVEEADPYVLAVAHRLRSEGEDARVVSEEFKTLGDKMGGQRRRFRRALSA